MVKVFSHLRKLTVSLSPRASSVELSRGGHLSTLRFMTRAHMTWSLFSVLLCSADFCWVLIYVYRRFQYRRSRCCRLDRSSRPGSALNHATLTAPGPRFTTRRFTLAVRFVRSFIRPSSILALPGHTLHLCLFRSAWSYLAALCVCVSWVVLASWGKGSEGSISSAVLNETCVACLGHAAP